MCAPETNDPFGETAGPLWRRLRKHSGSTPCPHALSFEAHDMRRPGDGRPTLTSTATAHSADHMPPCLPHLLGTGMRQRSQTPHGTPRGTAGPLWHQPRWYAGLATCWLALCTRPCGNAASRSGTVRSVRRIIAPLLGIPLLNWALGLVLQHPCFCATDRAAAAGNTGSCTPSGQWTTLSSCAF